MSQDDCQRKWGIAVTTTTINGTLNDKKDKKYFYLYTFILIHLASVFIFPVAKNDQLVICLMSEKK